MQLSRSSPKIRVQNLPTQKCTLLINNNDLRGLLVALEFAHYHDKIMLAATDQCGNLVVFEIGNNLEQSRLFAIRDQHLKFAPTPNHGINWCAFEPDGESQGDQSPEMATLAVVANTLVNIFSTDKLSHVISDPETITDIEQRRQIVEKELIAAVRISPDATYLAVVTSKGGMRFYEIDDQVPKLMKKWDPTGNTLHNKSN